MSSTTILKFTVRADSPISQAEGTQGNHSVHMMRKRRLKDGTIERVPIVSADSMRHGLRESGAQICLGLAGLLDQPKGPQLSEAALRLLFSGGMLTGRGDASTIRLDKWREYCETLPILALMGGCVDAQMIPGKLRVSDMELLCKETTDDHPPWRDQMDHVQRVRFDVTRDPAKQQLLSDGAKASVEGRMLAKETARAEGDTKIAVADRGRPMPHSHEAICAGSLWSWELTYSQLTEVEQATLFMTLALFFHSWRVGGKRGTGHGKLTVQHAEQFALPRFSELRTECDVVALNVTGKTLLEQHMKAKATQLAEMLAKVDA